MKQVNVRCKGLHGLDVQLTLKLGKTFECHALEAAATADQDEHVNNMVAVLESRAATYYKERVQSCVIFLKIQGLLNHDEFFFEVF